MSAAVGRIQWAKYHPQNCHCPPSLKTAQGPGRKGCSPRITIYDREGSFVCHVEDPRDVAFFERLIREGLVKVSHEQAKRRMFKSDEPVEPGEVVGAAV